MIYIIGSLRSPRPREVAQVLRGAGHDVFDDWHACGHDADQHWQDYELARDRAYLEALAAPFAQHAFNFDLRHLVGADVGVLVLPAGKSGHLELGYMIGKGARGYILLETPHPERWDLMYLLAHGVFGNIDELVEALR